MTRYTREKRIRRGYYFFCSDCVLIVKAAVESKTQSCTNCNKQMEACGVYEEPKTKEEQQTQEPQA